MAAGAYSRAFSSAVVTGSAPLAAAVTQILPAAGVAYPRYGEFTARVVATDDALHLQPVQIVDGSGTATMPVWTVRESDPDGTYRDVKIAGAELLHAIWSPDVTGLRGEPPWQGTLGRAAGNLEGAIAREGRLPVGHSMAISTPSELDDDAIEEYYELVAEAVAASDRDGFLPMLVQGQTSLDTGPGSFLKRYGPSWAGSTPQLEQTLIGAVLSACGVPPLLLSQSLGGSALRDGWRAFLSSGAQPVADQLARSASLTFGSEITIAVSSPGRHQTASDLVSRSRAVGSLTNAGVEVERALTIAGLA